MNLLTMNGIKKAHTDRILFEHADFSIAEGEKVGIIGINGTGKSTLLKMIAGEESLDAGEMVKGNQVMIQFLPQNPVFPKGKSIYDYVVTRNATKENTWTIEGEAKSILNQLGFQEYDILLDQLSGGEKKRVALAAALLTTCDILILDEPTNHLDSEMADWLESYLNRRKGALIMVTHDRYFLDQVCNRIVEIDKGKLYTYEGNYETFLELKAQREEMEFASERKRQSILRVELAWMQRGARARSTKAKGRIQRYEELKAVSAPVLNDSVEMSSKSSRLGKKTIELYEVSKKFEDQVLFRDFTYIFLRRDRIGIVGHNGCGKSTLMKVITQKLEPDSGHVEMGPTVKIGYFSQENEYMDTSLKVIDYIKETAEYIQTKEGTITASKMLERFLFDSTLQYQYIEKLSGGERRRLYLLKILMEAPNVLILDEPTNDLDISTLTIMEQYLDEFDGIVITVSHDRYFLDRIVTRIFAFEKEGVISQYEGNFTDYQIASAERGNERGSMKKGSNPTGRSQTAGDDENKEESRQKQGYEKPKRKLKFSYQEQKDYDSIEGEIADLEAKIEQLNTDIVATPTDFVKLNDLTNQKAEVESQLEEKMERWMYLQDLAERIANGEYASDNVKST